MKGEEKIPAFRKEKTSDNASRRIAIIVSIILFLILFILIYSFFHAYSSSRRRIDNIFESQRAANSHAGFETNSFSELILACDNKTAGESCSVNSIDGVCTLTGENRTVCMKRN